jgi:hypothetical protein
VVRLIEHARNRSAAGICFQLHFAGAASTQRSSAAADPHDGRQGTQGTLAGVQQDVFQSGSSVDSTGAVARALLLQMLYSVRSERLLIEEIDYNILFRWFAGLNLDDAVWDATVFTKNRDRLLEAEVAKDFLALVVEQARGQGWASDEHFTVDGSLLDRTPDRLACSTSGKLPRLRGKVLWNGALQKARLTRLGE